MTVKSTTAIATVMTLKTIKSNIKWIATTGKKFDAKVQDTLVGIFAHAIEHGDYRELNSLFHAMPNGSRRGTLVQYILDSTDNLKFDKATESFAKIAKKQPIVWSELTGNWYDATDKELAAIKADDCKANVILMKFIKGLEKKEEAGREIDTNYDQVITDLKAYMIAANANAVAA